MIPIPYTEILADLNVFRRALIERDILNGSARHFKLGQPKVPSRLSEHLVYHLLKKGLITLRFDIPNLKLHGTKIGDLSTSDGRNIGAKATGISDGFTSITKSDLKGDCIIWLNFYWFVKNQSDIISATVFYSPTEYFTEEKPVYSDVCERYSVGNDMDYIPLINIKLETKEEILTLENFHYEKPLMSKSC